jgi:hypothetical protein
VNSLFLLIVQRTVKRVQDNSISNFLRTQLAGIESLSALLFMFPLCSVFASWK